MNATPNTQCALHLLALIVSRPRNIELQSQCRSYFSSETLPESRPPHVRFWRLGENPTAESCLDARREEHTEDCRVGAEDWLVQNFELSKDSTLVHSKIHKTVFKRRRHPTKVTRTTSIVEPSLLEPTNVTNFPKKVPQSQHNHGRMDQTNHGKVIGNIMDGTSPRFVGPVRVPQLAVAALDQERCPVSKSQQCRNVQETLTMSKYRRNRIQYELSLSTKKERWTRGDERRRAKKRPLRQPSLSNPSATTSSVTNTETGRLLQRSFKSHSLEKLLCHLPIHYPKKIKRPEFVKFIFETPRTWRCWTLNWDPSIEFQPPSDWRWRHEGSHHSEHVLKFWKHEKFLLERGDFEYVHERLHVGRLSLGWRRWKTQEIPKTHTIFKAVRPGLEHLKKQCLGIQWNFILAELAHWILEEFLFVGTTSRTVIENKSSCVLWLCIVCGKNNAFPNQTHGRQHFLKCGPRRHSRTNMKSGADQCNSINTYPQATHRFKSREKFKHSRDLRNRVSSNERHRVLESRQSAIMSRIAREVTEHAK